jgi:hypothetical protein
MVKLMPSDITDQVRDVLGHAARGKGDRPNFLTAYQIFARLPEETKARLIAERGSIGGRGSGEASSAANIVAQAAQQLTPDVVVDYLDTHEIVLQINGETVVPGGEVCAVFRLRDEPHGDALLGSVTILGDIVGPFHDQWQGAP